MSGEYGYNTINGIDVPVVPGGVVRLQDRNNIVAAQSHSLRWHDLPDQTFIGGALKDTFYGESGKFHGMNGDDVFHLSGGLGSADGPIVAYGGAGNDAMPGTTGDTTFFGGLGQDYFSNVWEYFPQGEARFAIDMGAGADRLHFEWTQLSTPVGLRLLKQEATLEGGAGKDTLILDTVFPQLLKGADGQRSTSLDLRNAAIDGASLGPVSFRGFENYVILARNADVFDQIKLGSGDDYVSMGFFRKRTADIRIALGAGDDTVQGARQYGDEFIYGGAGDDVVISAGGYVSATGPGNPGARDFIYGGAGNDILFSGGPESGASRLTRQVGGSGNDIFQIGGPSSRIVDFHKGQDRLAFNFTTGREHAGLAEDVAGSARRLDVFRVVRDDEQALEFRFSYVTPFGTRERLLAHYDGDTGVLWLTHVMDADWQDRGRDSSGWNIASRITGAPDLSIRDFLLFDYF